MVMKQRVRFTPELLITAPRRSPGSPNSLGSHVLYTVSKYSLDSHSETNEVKVLDLETGLSTLFTDDKENKSVQWLVGTLVTWQRSKNDTTEIWIGSAVGEKNAYLAGKIDAAIDNVKTKVLENGNIAFGFTAPRGANGGLFNAEKAEKPKTSAREYESIELRYWDTYYPAELSTLWYTILEPKGAVYKLSTKHVDALKDTGIEFPSIPTAALGEGGSYHLAVSGIVLETRDPKVNAALDMKETIFYIPLKTFTETDAKVHRIEYKGYGGSASSAVVSPDGTAVAFKQQEGFHKPIANEKLFIAKLNTIGSLEEDVRKVSIVDGDKEWDRAPGSLFWSNDGETLFMTAEDKARTKLFKLATTKSEKGSFSVVPQPLTSNGSIVSAQFVSERNAETRIFVTYSSLVDSSVYALIDITRSSRQQPAIRIISDLSQHSSLLGLTGRSQISEFYTKSDDGEYDVHAWVLKPSFFKEGEKYPLWFMIHGGPAGNWADSWSTRWNPAVWAEQGYVVVSPNPTGSTGFGFDYTDAVNGDWGGRCYRDLVQCYKHVEDNMPFVDLDRAVAGGGSFGGYMANYIAGQELGQKFKALVSHDGVFSMVNMIATDVPTWLHHEVGAKLWEDPDMYNKYAPSSFTAGWSVPMLIIHSDGDYRCPITEGLAAYNVCQMKGIPSRFLNFPDETHFVLKRENSLQWYHSVLGWCNKYAKNEGHGNVQYKEPLTRGAFKAPEEIVGKKVSGTMPLREA